MEYRHAIYLARVLEYLAKNNSATDDYDIKINGKDWREWSKEWSKKLKNLNKINEKYKIDVKVKLSFDSIEKSMDGYTFFLRYVLQWVLRQTIYDDIHDKEMIKYTRRLVNSMITMKKWSSEFLTQYFYLLRLLIHILEMEDKERTLFLYLFKEMYKKDKILLKNILTNIYTKYSIENLNPKQAVKEVFKFLAIGLKDKYDFVVLLGKHIYKIQDRDYVIEFYNILLPYFGSIFIENGFISDEDIAIVFERIRKSGSIPYAIFKTIAKDDRDEILEFVSRLEGSAFKWGIFYCGLIILEKALELLSKDKKEESIKYIQLIIEICPYFDRFMIDRMKEFTIKYLKKYGIDDLVKKILRFVKINTKEEYKIDFELSLFKNCPPELLKDLQKLLNSLEESIKVCV